MFGNTVNCWSQSNGGAGNPLRTELGKGITEALRVGVPRETTNEKLGALRGGSLTRIVRHIEEMWGIR
jgi:hypothetical protein